jgi:hypothetical protein
MGNFTKPLIDNSNCSYYRLTLSEMASLLYVSPSCRPACRGVPPSTARTRSLNRPLSSTEAAVGPELDRTSSDVLTVRLRSQKWNGDQYRALDVCRQLQ